MKSFVLFLVFLLSISFANAQLNGSVQISGKVVDDRGKGSPYASVLIKGTNTGTTTDSLGNFSLVTTQKFPFKLVITSVGFEAQELELKSGSSNTRIQLTTQNFIGNEVVVTASRTSEKLLQSPVAIEKLNLRALKESPAASFYDALENLKGVTLTTSSLTFKVPNTRGFNIPNNFRFVQLNDGVDVQAATLGVPLGNAIGPTELDIESVEVTPGAASALYGANAINGLANLITKSPFKYQGLSVYLKGGYNHIGENDKSINGINGAKFLGEAALRYAKAFNDKFAFKFNVSYLRGYDWQSNTATDQNPNVKGSTTANPAYPELDGPNNNPAYDAWNKYADDAGSNAVTVSGVNYKGNTNNSFVVRRTGYWEKDLVNPIATNVKADIALHYKFNKNAELSYAYRFGELDGIFQRGNKIQLDNVRVQNHKLELKGQDYVVRGYVSIENTGDSYNLKPLADNLDLTNHADGVSGSNTAWGARFKTTLQNEINSNTDLAEAMRRARLAADAGRVEPGTPAFDALKNKIIKINNWDHLNAGVATGTATGGAWLRQMSRTYHADAQWDLTKYVKVFSLLVGGDYRMYDVIPDGNNFVDFSRPVADRTQPIDPTKSVEDQSFGKNVHYSKYGGFVQGTKTVLQDKLKISASFRVDNNPEFSPKVNPRVALVYTAAKKHNIRASWQNGFRFPALFEALSFVNNGNIRRVGGLSYINNGLGYLDNSYTLASVNSFNSAVNAAVKAGTAANVEAAALQPDIKKLLQVTSLSTTRPESISSFEIGYKSVLFNNKLLVDFDAYTNVYDGFLGQVEVSVPENNAIKVGTDQSIIDMLAKNRTSSATTNKQTRYRVYTNAKNKYNNYGGALALTYNFYKTFTVSGNLNYNAISKNKQPDVFVTGFNTPNWSTNLSIGNRAILPNLGFNIVWRWQDSFLWESPLVTGQVDAYSNLDAQITYRIPKAKTSIKLGGTNVLNKRYLQYAGGPTIGAFYYVAVTLEGLLSK